MNQMNSFKCSSCGKEHDTWPSLTYLSPLNYNALSEDDKENIAELSADFCVITYPDQTDRFIRVTLEIEVNDDCNDLDYGVWVSLSEKSYQDYWDNYNNEHHEVSYFGWLCNDPLDYESCGEIPTTVYTRTGNRRPYIVPHKDYNHPLVDDYYNGITKMEAERRIKMMELITSGADSDRES